MKSIVLFGDSLFGQFGKDRILTLEACLTGCAIYTCAAGGWNSEDGAKKAPYIATAQPDVAVISLGLNDAMSWKRVKLPTFKRNIQSVIDSFSSSEIIYFFPPPVDESKEFDDGMVTNEDILPYYDALQDLCRSNKLRFIDSRVVFEPLLRGGLDYHTKDGIHLNDRGYEVFMDELVHLLDQSSPL